MKRIILVFIVTIGSIILCSCSHISEEEYSQVCDKLNESNAKLKETNDEVNSLKNDIARLNSDVALLTSEKDSLISENDKLNADLSLTNTQLDELTKEHDRLQEKYEILENAYNIYQEKMQPYEELQAAEAEARKIEAEKIKKAEEEKKKKEEEEKAKKEKEEQKKGYNTGITYDQLARYPSAYKNQKIKFTGKVLQVQEEGHEAIMRLAVNNNSDTVLYCTYNPKILSFRLLEGDKVTVYGTSTGLITYTAVLLREITIPGAKLQIIELKK